MTLSLIRSATATAPKYIPNSHKYQEGKMALKKKLHRPSVVRARRNRIHHTHPDSPKSLPLFLKFSQKSNFLDYVILFFTAGLMFNDFGCGLLIKISLQSTPVECSIVRRKCKTGISHPRIYLTILYNGIEALMKLHWNSLEIIKTHQMYLFNHQLSYNIWKIYIKYEFKTNLAPLVHIFSNYKKYVALQMPRW